MRRWFLTALLLSLLALPASAVASRTLTIHLEAGGKAHLVPLPRVTNATSDELEVKVHLDEETPASRRHLRVELVDWDGTGDPVPAGAGSLHLLTRAGRCCPGGDFPGTLNLSRGEGAASVPLHFTVTVRGSALRCWGLPLLLTLGFGLTVMLVSGAVLNYRPLPNPARMAQRLTPVPGGAAPSEEVVRIFADALRPKRRLQNWLRAFPLVACLPGRHFHEALRLRLVPGHPAGSEAQLVPTANLEGRLKRNGEAERERGSLFVISNPSTDTSFIAVPDGRRVGKLKLGRRPGAQVVRLRDGEILLGSDDATKERGWKFRG